MDNYIKSTNTLSLDFFSQNARIDMKNITYKVKSSED